MSITQPKFQLVDEGTLDTVLQCRDCGAQLRYNYPITSEWLSVDPEVSDERAYEEFVIWALEDAEELHNCPHSA